MAPSVIYLGHRVDAEGLHPNPVKVEAVVQAPRPHSVSELKDTMAGSFQIFPLFLLLHCLSQPEHPVEMA